VSKVEPTESFIHKTVASLADGSFVRLNLSAPVDAIVPQKIFGRAVKLRGTLYLSLTLRYPTRDETRNLSQAEVSDWLRGQLGKAFHSALLGTTTRDWQFILKESRVARLVDHKPAKKVVPQREHDQKRTGLLDARADDWLIGLGVMNREGKVRASMADKYRQINHYLEIISHLARECGWSEAPSQRSALHFADMGCGKGYLTFGLWHLFARVWKQPVRVTGVESRADLVATTNRLAQQIHAEGLEFVRGEIASAKLDAVDALIALHACNTATDDAIRRGIELGAKLIVVAPCCHQEVRPQLGRPEPFAAVLQHGLMAERMAEWATDGLRALFLEWAGYRTKVMEFIGSEHTPKNLMIAAVREREAFADDAARERIVALKKFMGIKRHALDALLTQAEGKI
jgi:SAM-dependent methyltransferase